MRFVSKLLSTIVFSLLTFLALSPLAAALMKGSKSAAPVVLLLTLGVVGLLVFLAPTGRRAWGRGSLIAGAAFLALPGVTAVHDLHVWGLSTTDAALTAHIVHERPDGDALLAEAQGLARGRFDISHTTLQLETAVLPDCPTC